MEGVMSAWHHILHFVAEIRMSHSSVLLFRIKWSISCSFPGSHRVAAVLHARLYISRLPVRQVEGFFEDDLLPVPLPPCSQTCRYSCPWTTPPCTSLSLLTWGCPCAAWRFSTNLWTSLQHPASWPPPLHNNSLIPTATTSSSLTVPCPSTSCGTSCVWQVGVLFLCSDPFIPSSLHLPALACEKAVYPFFIFLFHKFPHLHVFYIFVFLVCPVFYGFVLSNLYSRVCLPVWEQNLLISHSDFVMLSLKCTLVP